MVEHFEKHSTELRQRAEARVGSFLAALAKAPQAIQRLVHELNLHQVELEMQYEETAAPGKRMLGSDACSHAARESRGGCFNRRAGLLLDHPPCIASHPSSLVHSHRLLHRGSIVRPTDGTAQHAGASRSCSVEANTSRILRVNVSGV